MRDCVICDRDSAITKSEILNQNSQGSFHGKNLLRKFGRHGAYQSEEGRGHRLWVAGSRPLAMCLKDSGVQVKVGLADGSKSKAKAEAAGLKLLIRLTLFPRGQM